MFSQQAQLTDLDANAGHPGLLYVGIIDKQFSHKSFFSTVWMFTSCHVADAEGDEGMHLTRHIDYRFAKPEQQTLKLIVSHSCL